MPDIVHKGTEEMKKRKNIVRRDRVLVHEALLEVQNLIEDLPLQRDMLIEYLHRIQDKHHHLSDHSLWLRL